MKVVIAGASGFVGRALMKTLEGDPKIAEIRALARSFQDKTQGKVTKRACDLYSVMEIEKAIGPDVDTAIYLVHSMSPSSELAQGEFQDYDLLLADNFARACQNAKVKRVIYLGGIIPKGYEPDRGDSLSAHLSSRLEVEKIFSSYSFKLVALRAGIILGIGGSSFEIVTRLVRRLPVLICPHWTQTKSSPIHINDVCESFRYLLSQPKLEGVFNLLGPETLRYVDMIKITAQCFGKKRLILNVPVFTPTLSKLWVRTITGAPKDLVYPLIDSLNYDLKSDPNTALHLPGWKYKSFEESVIEYREAIQSGAVKPKAFLKPLSLGKIHIVQSMMRFTFYQIEFNAVELAKEYFRWLNSLFFGLIKVHIQNHIVDFKLLNSSLSLLQLSFSPERSSPDRQLYYITGGVLASQLAKGRIEFRLVPSLSAAIIAIHNFQPYLPWYIYKYTQALIHQWVMKRFKAHLSAKPMWYQQKT